jgi:hypothetical protein
MSFDLSETVRFLSSTPGILRAVLSDLPDGWKQTSGDADSWSLFDIVGHLIHGEETDWIPRAKIILEQGENRTFVPFDRFAQFERSKGKSLADLLDEFETRRSESLDTLRSWDLAEDQLSLPGVHPELGPVTLHQLLATWPVHDLTHIRQIAVLLAKRYESEVGPWKEYLSILN